MSIAERQAIVDSVRDVQVRAAAAGIKTPEREIAAVMAGVAMANATGVNTGKPGEGFSVNVVRADSVAAGVASRQPGQAPSAPAPAAIPFGVSTNDLEYLAASNLPDRYPAFLANAVSVDRDDNLWIRTTLNDPASKDLAMYDVVDRTGALIRRVRIPSSRTIAGFGTDGSLFLRFPVENGWMLERTRLIK